MNNKIAYAWGTILRSLTNRKNLRHMWFIFKESYTLKACGNSVSKCQELFLAFENLIFPSSTVIRDKSHLKCSDSAEWEIFSGPEFKNVEQNSQSNMKYKTRLNY